MGANGWIQTYTGKKFFPLSPSPDLIDIQDVAHALSHLCRYAGHTPLFYSVAQHSVLVARILREQGCSIYEQMWGLLHDATEAYLIDLPQPVKMHMREYQRAEERLMQAVAFRFNLSPELPESVKIADEICLATEVRDIIGHQIEPWHIQQAAMPWTIRYMDCGRAKSMFLDAYTALQRERSRDLTGSL
jgi:hypothetical protein